MTPYAQAEPHSMEGIASPTVWGLRRSPWSAIVAVLGLAIVPWALCTDSASATHETDQMIERVASNDLGEMHYLEFVPEGLAPGSPVVVHLHGANNAAADAAHRSRLNTLARERGFVAVYPQEDPDNGNNGIWSSDTAAVDGREGRAVSLIAQLTNEVIERLGVDRRFVFLSGISAGAGMAGSLIGWYPDLYTAMQVEVSVVFGGGDNDATTAAHQMVEAMGEHARRIPMVLSYGTADPIAQVVDQPAVIQHWLIARDLMDDGKENGSVARDPKESRTGSDGKTYTVDTYADENGCVFVENWVIEGMFHAYAGGDQTAPYDVVADPDAPNMREYAYDFFMDQLDENGPPGCLEGADAPASSVPAGQAPPSGETISFIVENDLGSMSAQLYVPSTRGASGAPMPLVVALHGGNESTERTATVSGWNLLADEFGLLVVYPQEDPDNGRLGIWDWAAVPRNGRDDRGASLVALVTTTVRDEYSVDPEQVMLTGMSAGAGMAVATAVTFPELYAAVGAESGCGYGTARCQHPPSCTTDGCQTDGAENVYATGEDAGAAAHVAMGERARRMPVVVSYGDEDVPGFGVGQDDHVTQWLALNDWVDDDEANESVPRTAAESIQGQEGGAPFGLQIHLDADGCVVLQRWIIEGLGHAYSGARNDDGETGYGPDMRRHQLEFLRSQAATGGCEGPDADAAAIDAPSDDATPDAHAPGLPVAATGGGMTIAGTVLLATAGRLRRRRSA